jgi:MFS family permease
LLKNEKWVLIRFNLIQVLYWCGFASMAAFVSAFMLSKGMSNTQLSLMLAIYMLCAFVGQFFWGSICDKLKTNKKIFILGEILVLALYYLIYKFSNDFSVVMILYPILGFVMVPLPSNLDAWLLKCFVHRPEVYGPARGWASMGFAVFMLIYGNIIAGIGYHVMPAFATVFIVTTIILSSMQPDSPEPEGERAALKLRDIGKLTKIKPYMFIIVLLLFTGLAIAPINNMKIVVLENVGGTVVHQGYDSFFMCVAQLPFFFLAGKIRKIPQNIRLLLSAAGPMCMILINFFAASPYMVILASVFNAISYSILLPTIREITEASTDKALRTTAHGIADAVFQSLAGMVSLLYVGSLMDNVGMSAVFIICICFQSVALILAVIKTFFRKNV